MSYGALPSPKTVFALLIVVTIFHALALILTSFRLLFRYRTRRLWWDDFWAALALLTNAISMVVIWPNLAPLDNPYTNFEALPTRAQSRNVHIITVWLSILSYTCSIWFSRTSIVFSVIRIIPPTGNGKTAAILSSILFLCLWAYMFLSKIVVCAEDDSWHNAVVIQCALPEWVAMSEVITDVLSDLILVALPLRFLWRVKLPPKQKIMFLSIFSASILVSIVSAVHTAYIIHGLTFIGPLTAELGGAVSLIVCNLLVVVTFIYRVTRNGSELSQVTGKQTCSSNRLTTVDLDYQGTWFSSPNETGFTNTAITGTNISSVIFMRPGGDATFGSVMSGGTIIAADPEK